MRFLLVLAGVALSVTTGVAADLSSQEKQVVNSVNDAVKNAGAAYAAGKYDSAGEHIRQAMKQVDEAGHSGSKGLIDALDPALKRISKAHAMLEFEGVSLPPFRRPVANATASAMETSKPVTKPVPKKPTPPKPTPTRPKPNDPNAISFTSHVAPILANRCGRCHIQGSKGQFNLGTFAKLMKGPPEGVVVFAGDTIGSRLIETIETGDMPRGGNFPANELAV